MTRKSKIVTLSILGVVAAVASCACCINWQDDVAQQNAQGGHGGGTVHRSRGFWPLFLGSSSSRSGGSSSRVGVGTSSGTSRGGFGATSSRGGSSGSHGSASS